MVIRRTRSRKRDRPRRITNDQSLLLTGETRGDCQFRLLKWLPMEKETIQVEITFKNVMAGLVGAAGADLALPFGAGFDDLLMEIGRRFSPQMRPGLWDQGQNRFKKGVVGIRNHEILRPGENTALSHGDRIEFFLTMAGG